MSIRVRAAAQIGAGSDQRWRSTSRKTPSMQIQRNMVCVSKFFFETNSTVGGPGQRRSSSRPERVTSMSSTDNRSTIKSALRGEICLRAQCFRGSEANHRPRVLRLVTWWYLSLVLSVGFRCPHPTRPSLPRVVAEQTDQVRYNEPRDHGLLRHPDLLVATIAVRRPGRVRPARRAVPQPHQRPQPHGCGDAPTARDHSPDHRHVDGNPEYDVDHLQHVRQSDRSV